MKNRIVKFTKIPLKNLIDALVMLYDGGADYVDIMGETGQTQDEIGLAIREEYMAPDEELYYEDGDEEISEDDLNDLI